MTTDNHTGEISKIGRSALEGLIYSVRLFRETSFRSKTMKLKDEDIRKFVPLAEVRS